VVTRTTTHHSRLGKRYVLVGGPGFGKTTIIKALRKRGFLGLEEASRIVFREEKLKGNSKIWKDKEALVIKITYKQIEMERVVPRNTDVFFERTFIDFLAYCEVKNIKPPQVLLEQAKLVRVDKVFLIEPLFNIEYHHPFHDFEEALAIHHATIKYYGMYDYELIKVPEMPVDKRVTLILNYVYKD